MAVSSRGLLACGDRTGVHVFSFCNTSSKKEENREKEEEESRKFSGEYKIKSISAAEDNSVSAITYLTFSPNSKYLLVVSCSLSSLTIYSPETGVKLIKRVPPINDSGSDALGPMASQVCFSNCSRYIFSVGVNGIRRWSVTTGEKEEMLWDVEDRRQRMIVYECRDVGKVCTLSVSPCNTLVVTGGWDGFVRARELPHH